jgi:ubiquitin carboxyl-terminal hydrolase 8
MKPIRVSIPTVSQGQVTVDLPFSVNKGLTGLANLGNTCFLNSCVQVLCHTYELDVVARMSSAHRKTNSLDTQLWQELDDLKQVMRSGNGVVSPNKFVTQLQSLARMKKRDLFTGWAQNDMPEFLLFVIESMHQSISRKLKVSVSGKSNNSLDDLAKECLQMLRDVYAKEYSEIMDMFYGIYVSEILSMDGAVKHVIKPEPYFILDLPIPILKENRAITLYDCFRSFTAQEILTGDNGWNNPASGQKESVHKRMTFWNFPPILVITLKRFSPDGMRKTNDFVQFPLHDLNLSEFVSGYHPAMYVYDLYGVCYHMGSVMGGHYTASVKTHLPLDGASAGDTWINFNDSHMEKIANPLQMVTPLAYCLFYRRKNIVSI